MERFEINSILSRILNGTSNISFLFAINPNQLYGMITDSNIINNLICFLDQENRRDEIWDLILNFINPDLIDDHCFDYFYKNNISIERLAHLSLKDEFLKVLMQSSDEAYSTLALRYYNNDKYPISDFIELLINCKFETVFLNLFMQSKNINKKNIIIHKIIEKNHFLSQQFKALSKNIQSAKILFCTDDTERIEQAFNDNNYIYFISISQNINTPDYILRSLASIKNIKYGSKIRGYSAETLKIKQLFDTV